MPSDRFQQIENIYHDALKLLPSERADFVAKACGDDEELRKEIESLLSFADEAEDFIETPPDDVAASLLKTNNSQKLVGKELNHYRILSSLGVGGMGEVYLAEDTKLGRKIALKLLPAQFSDNPERKSRFEQEARAASALNHPNIITIYSIEQADEISFIATEFIDGQTLRERIADAPLALNETLEIGIQIAGALEAAHAVGIVHRDIKPANIMLRRDGYVKVLDFGLAKLTIQTDGSANVDTRDLTNRGRVMGTINYMSPEQALGQKIDTRTDIFSLGVVLYEMVTGIQPFNGISDAAIYDAILHKTPPPLTNVNADLPSELELIINHAIEKDRDMRYQTASDLRVALQNLKGNSNSGMRTTANLKLSTQPHEQKSKSARNKILIASVAMMFIVAAYFLFFNKKPNNIPATVKNINFTQLTSQSGAEFFPNLSPDGKTILYSSRSGGNWDIYFQRVGGTNTVNLTKDSVVDDTQAVYSPDGENIAFRSERDGGGIFVMGATGESVKRVTNVGYYPAWSPDEKEIAFCVDNFEEPMNRTAVPSALWAVKVATGEKRLITQKDATQPNWSPNGYRIAYWGITSGGQRDIFTISAKGGEPVQVTNDASVDWNPVWSPDGKYLYFASNRSGSMNLWRVPIEEQTGKLLGSFETVTTPSTYSQHLSFSRDGKLFAYVQATSYTNIMQVGFNPVSEAVAEKSTEITKGSKLTTNPYLSPDGEWLAFDGIGDKQEDIYVIKRDGTGLRQLTNDIYKDRVPRWSPDGKRLAFFSDRTGRYEGWIINADGSNLQQVTFTKDKWAQLPVWSPDGNRLLFNLANSYPMVIDANKAWSEQTPQMLPTNNAPDQWILAFSWSPDGEKLAAYQRRSEAFRSGILTYNFASQKYEQLTDFGVCPVWLNDSRRLIFLNNDKLYVSDSQTKKTKEIMSVTPHHLQSLTISNDNRSIFYSLQSTEADIWLAVIE